MTLTHSESMDKLAPALAALQAKLGNVAHDAENPHFRHGYTSLPAFLEAVRGPLGEHGFSFSQHPGIDDLGRVIVETFLLHESGQWLRSVAASPAVKAEPQAIGSAITYLRRYALAAVLNIAQEDDDAEQQSPRTQRPAQARRPPKGAPVQPAAVRAEGPTSKEIGDAMRVLGLGVGDVAACYGVDSRGETVVAHLRELMSAGEPLEAILRKVALDRAARVEAEKRKPPKEESVEEVERRILAEHAAENVSAR